MRILYLTNGYPFPLTSGYLRHYFLLRELARRHSITLLSLHKGELKQEHRDAMTAVVDEVHVFPIAPRTRSGGGVSRLLRDLRYVTGTEPAVQAMRKKVAELTQSKQFDVVFFSGKQTQPLIADLEGKYPVVADICDAASVRTQGRLEHARLFERPRLILLREWMRRTERRVTSTANHTLFASRRDRDAVLNGSGRPGTVIPNGVECEYWQRRRPTRGQRTMIFTGAMHYPPNADAALQLIREILPRVRKSIPDARLLIVGRDPSAVLIEAGKTDGVTVTGFVDDVRPYLEEATVFAAPLRFASGIQNKLLEAMAMELPVVTSSAAVEGLRSDEALPPIDVADSSDAFAEAIVAEMTRAETDAASFPEMRNFVKRHFNWRRNGQVLETILESVITETHRAPVAEAVQGVDGGRH